MRRCRNAWRGLCGTWCTYRAGALRYVAAASRQIPLARGFCKRRLRVKLTLIANLFLNLNFILARPLLNLIISALPIKFCRYASSVSKAKRRDTKRGQILFWEWRAKQESLPGSIGVLNFIYKTTARRFASNLFVTGTFISNRIARLNFGQPPSDFIAD